MPKHTGVSLYGPTPRLGHAHGLLASASFPGCALAICQAVIRLDAAFVAEMYHLVYGVGALQAVIAALRLYGVSKHSFYR